MNKLYRAKEFFYGYNSITREDDKELNTMMDFGILKMKGTQTFEEETGEKEAVYLLIEGEVFIEIENTIVTLSRSSCFESSPSAVHVPKNTKVKITCKKDEAEVCIVRTTNEKEFPIKVYKENMCRSELRGQGTMNEMATRIVRTVFDYSTAPYSNLVIGEVVNFPGKWSSYPPHHHPQPEIYFYKFLPANGFGYGEHGEEVYKIRHNDTLKILGGTHSQVAAPGYAMYYIWVIRHLEGNPYIEPTFVEEHKWVMDSNAKIWNVR